MELSLTGKNALVGGSSKGIGKATAMELAALGANVTLMARTESELQAVQAAMDTAHGQTHGYLVVDYSNRSDLQQQVQELLMQKPIHILVNNTGGPAGGPITQAGLQEFEQAYHNHLLCNHLLAQLVLPGMKKAGYGRIINIISTSVKEPIDGLGVSNTTRWAVASWAKTLANEVGQFGVTVNNVLPGFTDTQRLRSLLKARAESAGVAEVEMTESWKNSVPMQRFADPSEVGAVAAFLASPAASYINGVALPVDGGRTKSM